MKLSEYLIIVGCFSVILFTVEHVSSVPVEPVAVVEPVHILSHVTSSEGLECVRRRAGGLSCNWDKYNREQSDE